MLKSHLTTDRIEAGCDEAGRGSLAGPLFAAAVIFPKGYQHPLLNDSKQLSRIRREQLRKEIERDASAWAVCRIEAATIDEINVLNASFLGMEEAVKELAIQPELLLIDGNRFRTSLAIPFRCIVKGDGKYLSIAAASVLAKTYRDDFMEELHDSFPEYHWKENKGYPTQAHRKAIASCGISPHHRRSYRLEEQMKLKF